MRVVTRAMIAVAAAGAMSVGVGGVSHGLRVPKAPGPPRIHIHIPRILPGATDHGSGGASNCGNGAAGSNGRHGANGATNVDGKARGGKGGKGSPGGKGGNGSRC